MSLIAMQYYSCIAENSSEHELHEEKGTVAGSDSENCNARYTRSQAKWMAWYMIQDAWEVASALQRGAQCDE